MLYSTGNAGKPSCLQLAVVLPDIFLIGVQIPSQRIYNLILGHLNPTKSNSKMANLARIVAVYSPKNTIIAMEICLFDRLFPSTHKLPLHYQLSTFNC